MKVDFFCVKIHHYVFDVSNGEHKVPLQFILVDLSIWLLAPDLTLCFIPVKLEAKPIPTWFFKLSVHIRSAYNLQPYFKTLKFH